MLTSTCKYLHVKEVTCLMNLEVIDHSYSKFVGDVLLMAACSSTSLGGVSVLNHSFGRKVLPLGSPTIK